MKRKAEYNLEREEFLRGDKGEDSPQQTPQQSSLADNIATAEQIAQRRIVKLKMPTGVGQQESGERPAAKFELAGNFGVQNQQNGGTKTQEASFISNIVTNPSASTTEQAKPAASGSLFSSILNKSTDVPLGTKPAEEQKSSLFSNIFNQGSANAPLAGAGTGTGLFSQNKGLFSSNTTSTSGTSTGGGLFSSIFPGTAKGFENLAKKDYSFVHQQTGEKEEEEVEKKPSKLEEKAPSKPSLFASLGEYKPSTLFSSDSSKPPLLSGLATGGGLGSLGGTSSFTGLLAGAGKRDDSDNEEEGDDEPQRSPSPEADITKSKGNYQYQYDYEKIVSKKVTKCKPGAMNMLNEGEISLNKGQAGNYFIAYRNKAKLIQYQGQLLPGISKIQDLNNRGDAISVIAISTEKEEKKEGEQKEGEATEEKKKPTVSKDVVKLMFSAPDDCKEFKKGLESVLGVN